MIIFGIISAFINPRAHLLFVISRSTKTIYIGDRRDGNRIAGVVLVKAAWG